MSIGEYIVHYNAVRTVVLGAGTLHVTLFSLPDYAGTQREVALRDINLDIIGRKTPTCLANFKEQAVQVKMHTDEIDDVFRITRIIIFKLPVEVSFPG
jgi:hypothetical protein